MKILRKYFTAAALLFAMVFVARAQTTFTLDPLASFGTRGDGSIQPGDVIGVNPQSGNSIAISAVLQGTTVYGVQPGDAAVSTNGFNMRGLAYDPMSSNLVFVDTHEGSGGSATIVTNAAIYILDHNSGQIIGALNTNGITGGSYTHVVSGVANDGVVYVCNQTTASATTGFKIYRWATADTNNPSFTNAPSVAFSNTITPSDRLGETMAVRGAGTNTQILINPSTSLAGTNIYLFTTADGTNFTSHRLTFAGITNAIFNDGVAFGPGNTFFTKQVGQPLSFLAFSTVDGTNYTGSVISQFSASSTTGTDPLLNLAGIAVDNVHGLLAGLEEIGGTASAGPAKVWLFAIPNPTNQAPAILTSRTYGFNDTKATATMGYLCFGAGRLYANVVNNGLLASSVDSITMPAPTFTLPPDAVGLQPRPTDLPASTRAALGQTVHFEVFATPNVTNYQWYSNNVAISGATTYFLNVTNVQTNFSGTVYYVTAMNAAGSSNSVHSTLTVVSAGSFFHPAPLWSATAAGSLTATNIIDIAGGLTAPNERCIAYNAVSNQLLVARGPAAFANLKVFVVNADTGAILWSLNTNGMVPSLTLNLCGIGVADDGAVYAATVGDATVSGSDQTFKVYRWPDTGSNTLPQLIFGTNSSAATANPVGDIASALNRFGDTLAVHGAGNNTEVVVDCVNPTSYVGILRPKPDGTMTNWTQTGYLDQNTTYSYGFQNAYGTGVGRSVQFGPNLTGPFGSTPTFWQKRYFASGSPLAAMGYTPGGGLSPLDLYNFGLPLSTNGPMGINFTLNLAAAVDFAVGIAQTTTGVSTLDFYDVSDPTQAVLLSKQNLPAGNSAGHFANANAIGQVIFGANPNTGTNYLFAIEGNNGIAAYYLSGGVAPAPKILAQPGNFRIVQGSSGSMSVQVDQLATIQWYKGTNSPVNTGVTGSSYSITNAQLTDGGDYFVIATNLNGSVTSQVAHVTVSLAGDNYSLTQIWSATPNDTNFPYVTSTGGSATPTERCFAYNARSNQLIVVSLPVLTHNYNVYVVDGLTGTNLYTMNTTNVVNEGTSEVAGSNPLDLCAVAVADDGAVYICSETPNASGGGFADTTKMLHVFRWADSGPNTTNMLVYEGDPSGQPSSVNLRWGDVMAARGSGTNTQLILNSYDGAYAAVLVPTDGTMTQFTNSWFADTSGGGSIGRSIQFGATNSVFEKRKGTQWTASLYNTNTQTSSLLSAINSSTTLGGIYVSINLNLAVGVDFVGSTTAPLLPDAVALYDVAEPTTPLLVNHYSFPSNQVANQNFICQSVVAGLRAYSLDANNGMAAFYINPPTNAMVLKVAPAGTNVNLSWGATVAILQGTTNLNPTAWADLLTAGQTNSLQPVGRAQFYRLVVRR